MFHQAWTRSGPGYLSSCPNCVLILSFRLEQKTVERKRVFANLKVLEHVLDQVSKEIFEEVVYITQSTIGQSSSVDFSK